MDFRWAFLALFLLAATGLFFLFVRVAGELVFGPLKDSGVRKRDLLIYALVPLSFFFELGYHFDPLFSRLGHFFPILGRQLGFDWELFDFASGPGAATPWQIFLVIIGALFSLVILAGLLKRHQKEPAQGLNLQKSLPVLLLAATNIWMFLAG